ncbi:hypothetical protein [Luteibacter sp.]|uniref:hypothetical protein n=1 Tax=Luteibacter sp. TaxID=1886636 RepID=UPI0025BBB385|nr:hypothetical protein [Luteibacter sp.]
MKIKGNRQDAGGRIAPKQSASKPASLNYPVFCLRHLQNGHDLSDCEDADQRQLIAKLRHLSKMDWSQIEQAPRHGSGKENISRTSIKKEIPRIVTEDVKLWSLRFSGMKAMVGFRSGDIFHLLWLDHDFSVYGH